MAIHEPKQPPLHSSWRVFARKEGESFKHPHRLFFLEYCNFHGVTPHIDQTVADIDFTLKKNIEFTCNTCGFGWVANMNWMVLGGFIPKCPQCRERIKIKSKPPKTNNPIEQQFLNYLAQGECDLTNNYQWKGSKAKHRVVCSICGDEKEITYAKTHNLRTKKAKWTCSKLCWMKYHGINFDEENRKKKNFVRIDSYMKERHASMKVIGDLFTVKSDLLLTCKICGMVWIKKVTALTRAATVFCPNGCSKTGIQKKNLTNDA